MFFFKIDIIVVVGCCCRGWWEFLNVNGGSDLYKFFLVGYCKFVFFFFDFVYIDVIL